MFAKHPEVAWLSKYSEKYPAKPHLTRYQMKMIDFPFLNKIKRGNYPEECYSFWEYYCRGFRTPCRDLLAEDVSSKAKNGIRSALSQMITSKRRRLLIKITGWPRIGYLHEIFNDAKFIHVVRDGRAVVNSMINVDWWWGWRGPQNWRWGELNASQQEEWKKFNKSFIALAGIELKILMEALEKGKKRIDSKNFREIKYEELCADPNTVFKEVIHFSELEWSESFAKSVKNFVLNDRNDKWKTDLSVKQQNVLEAVLADYLKNYDYK
jgi:hypothetical protein